MQLRKSRMARKHRGRIVVDKGIHFEMRRGGLQRRQNRRRQQHVALMAKLDNQSAIYAL